MDNHKRRKIQRRHSLCKRGHNLSSQSLTSLWNRTRTCCFYMFDLRDRLKQTRFVSIWVKETCQEILYSSLNQRTRLTIRLSHIQDYRTYFIQFHIRTNGRCVTTNKKIRERERGSEREGEGERAREGEWAREKLKKKRREEQNGSKSHAGTFNISVDPSYRKIQRSFRVHRYCLGPDWHNWHSCQSVRRCREQSQ